MGQSIAPQFDQRCTRGAALSRFGAAVLYRVSRLRVAAIRFLNPAPLMWDFDHPPHAATLHGQYQIETMMPAQCAERLAAGTADLGLVPTAAFAENPSLRIVPGCAIASKGPIRSLLLVYRRSSGREAIRTIAADTSSRATLAYLQIIARHYWRLPARFLAHAPNLDVMLAAADAALLIGDPALLALEDREAREARTGESLVYLDLGAEWQHLTGLPWISAVWGVRAEALNGARSGAGRSRDRLMADLNASRDAGISHIDDLSDEWATRIAVPRATIQTYLSRNIYYVLDDECLEGLRRFYALAAECHVLPPLPELPML
jgi:chorismate dehydratase